MVDEFQDTDAVQYRILSTLFLDGETTLFLIGDPKQAIYAFRGADVFTYLDAARDAGERVFTMDTNWRSDPAVIEGINWLFADHDNPFLHKRITYPRVRPRPDARDRLEEGESTAAMRIAYIPGDGEDNKPRPKAKAVRAAAEGAAREIAALLAGDAKIDGRPVEPGDVAVLVRTHDQSRAVREALQPYGVPAVVRDNKNVFQTEEADDLELVLNAVLEPGRSRDIKVAMTTKLLGVTAAELLELEADEDRWENWLERFRVWHDLWLRQGFIQMFRHLMSASQLQQRLFRHLDGERRVTNLLHLSELLQAAAVNENLGPTGLTAWLNRQRDPGRTLEDPAFEMRLESDARAVQVATIHASKGLEFPVVFCPFLWDSRGEHGKPDHLLFHDSADEHRLKLDVGSEDFADHHKLAQQENYGEYLRLLYVALTRAKHRCVLLWGHFNRWQDSPLAWLLFAEAGDEPDALRKRLKGYTDAELQEALAARCAASGDRWSLYTVGEAAAPALARDHEVQRLSNRHFDRALERGPRTGSFTMLTARASGPHTARDLDPLESEAGPPLATEGGTWPITLREFPKGPKAGIFFHEIFEHLDFTDQNALEPLIARHLRNANFDVTRWT
jgi:exodeoxyribonuclease V beta subunit